MNKTEKTDTTECETIEACWDETTAQSSLLELSNTFLLADSIESIHNKVLPIIKRLLKINGLLMLPLNGFSTLNKPLMEVFDENRLAETTNFHATDQVRDSFPTNLLKQVMAAEKPVWWLMSDLMKLHKRPTFITRYRINKVKKIIAAPYFYDNGTRGIMIFFSADDKPAVIRELDFTAKVIAQLAPGILRLQKLEEQRDHAMIATFYKKVINAKSVIDIQNLLTYELEKLDYIKEACLLIRQSENDKFMPFIVKTSMEGIFAKDPEAFNAIRIKTSPLNAALTELTHAKSFRLPELAIQTGTHSLFANWSKYSDWPLMTKPLLSQEAVAGTLLYFANSYGFEKFERFWDATGSMIALMVDSFAVKGRQKELLSELDILKRQLGLEQQANLVEQQDFRNYIVGNSTKMQEIFNLITKVSPTDSSVLILGETGTGKEMLARAIHRSSLRKDQPFIKVNCATLPPNLIESELFGHERGSFTGAFEKKIGKFELANNGTIFLDEIGELPLNLQTKLLRALQEKEIERIGGKHTIKIDIRIISATNRDLLKFSQQGSFRTDLYFRLNVFPVELPSLKERKEDIPLLVSHFAAKYTKRNSSAKFFSSKAMKQLIAYNWPGNIRELEHLVQRSVILSKGKVVNDVYLPANHDDDQDKPLSNLDVKTIDEVERDHILSVLKMVNGKISGVGGAAEILKIPATTLSSKIIKLKIKKGFADPDDVFND